MDSKLGLFVFSVVDNIGLVNMGNALKIRGSLKLKDSDTGFELEDFFRAVVSECVSRATKSEERKSIFLYSQMVIITLKSLKDLKTSKSKQDIFDLWVFDIKGLFDV